MFKYFSYYLFLVVALSSCKETDSNKSEDKVSIKFLDKTTVKCNRMVDSTIVGGLSSIDYISNNTFVVISDDRSEYSPARFYEMEIIISQDSFKSHKFNKTILLKNEEGDLFETNELDPESIRFRASSDSYFYTSEGGRTNEWLHPYIWEINRRGEVINTITVPDLFRFSSKKGVRENGGFESLSFENDSIIWYANELPLKEDGEVPGFGGDTYPIRLVRQDIKNGVVLDQYAYQISSLKTKPNPETGFFINSVPEIMYIDENRLWVLERSYTTGVGNFVKLFEVDITNATDIQKINSLIGQEYTSVEKSLILDFSAFNQRIDNIEGMTFGPDFPDGSKSLIFISDDNFNAEQETQLWLFKIEYE
ncbi:3-phytase [Marivirga tractuosa]|uniref:Phytase-like domain-containing protein n=1 Tax=Marivirga tractuosa (strain ATCC 23168 / DSM 4126 / NBRC 15989 / NCIMB 1408 / VKM B-1430 / H-43) TaxID=643867 RepID=E4TSH0_MARTH|nr:esterase-like activity of phytase family protein [Marivirga tractuosa]ADR20790.1 hypothetical protein Ftrac_0788 [Marivirga tractuosa DSM 4126]BDD14759.1 3-phytase [Marivirga tractuosa]